MTIKLNLESTNSGDYVATHKDGACIYRVTVSQDSDCPSPTDDYSRWPMLIKHSRCRVQESGDMPNPLDCFTPGQLIRHQRAIAAALSDSDYRWNDGDAVTDLADWKRERRGEYCSMADCIRGYFNKLLDDLPDSERFAAWHALYSLAGIESLDTCGNGYSQSDYFDCLIVATPDAMRAFGWTPTQRRDKASIRDDMARQVKTYEQWISGDCYGYTVERRAPSGDWQDVDSCWGFIGDYDDKYMVGQATDSIRRDIELRARRRSLRLAQLIRARVATDKRAALLDIAEYGA